MDITVNALKNMKSKQLRKIIREAIEEVLSEGEAENKAAEQAAKQNHTAQQQAADAAEKAAVAAAAAAKAKKAAVAADKNPGLMEENELDEMARLAKGFRLADPNVDSSQFTKSISGTPLSAVIDYFRENPGADKKSLQSQFNFVRPQIANAIVNGLLDAGILTKLSASGEEEAPTAPGEAAPTQATEPEDLFIGSSENPLSMYFDNEPNDDGTEDMNDEEEPTAGEVEPASEPASTGGMSDEDYEVFMKYSDLKDRLNATKSNLLKMKRSKGGTAGDISDKPGTEMARLQDLKKSLEDRVNALVAGSEYLQKKVEKETGKAYEPIEIEPEEEEPLDEAFDAAYEKRKIQFYAGIIK